MSKFWAIRSSNPELAACLAKEQSLLPPVAQLLVNRGISQSEVLKEFLNPRLRDLADPFLLPDMDKAVDRVLGAIQQREKIVIFGDYDVDGMTSIALLLEVLQKLGAICGYYLPSRFTEGYGLKTESLGQCAQDGARVLISVDCGTNSAEEIRFAKSRGMDCIVLDHHQHDGSAFEALAVVNPKRADSRYREELASVGISFKFAHALLKKAREQSLSGAGQVDLKQVLDFVAVGTIADMVPLLGENRILVRAGLEQLACTSHCGLRILRDIAGVHGVPTATDVAFRIAPRLNASGRLSDAKDSLDLLCASSETQAMLLAQNLHQQNMRRTQIEKQATEEAIQLVAGRAQLRADSVLVLYQPHWHIGVVGIVAAKLARQFGKPAMIIGSEAGMGRGSVRCPDHLKDRFHAAEALAEASGYLVSHGGHAGAAGFSIEPARVEEFRVAVNARARQLLEGASGEERLDVELELEKEQLSSTLIEQLECLEPFGTGNPRPVFATRRIGVEGMPQIVGTSHLKFQTRIADTLFDVMGFRMADQARGDFFALAGRKIDIAYTPCINIFNGRRRFQLNLEDYRLI